MTRSNRSLNRLFIAGAGVVLLGTAAWIAVTYWKLYALPAVPAPTQTAEWVTVAVCVVLIVLAILWIVTRGRGRTRTLLSRTDDRGTASIAARVAADLVQEDLRRFDDVTGVSTRAFRVRGTTVLELRVTTRRFADVRSVIDRVGTAVAALDEVLEESVPIVLHIVGAAGSRTVRAR